MKKYMAVILICMLAVTGCGNSSSTGNKALDGDLELESNQSLLIAQVKAVYGNEITLALAKEAEESESTGKMRGGKTTDSSSTGNTEESSENAEGGNPPSSSDMPPGRGESSDEENTSSEKDSSDKSSNKAQTQMTKYTLTGEEMTTTIPVGTPVTTLLGTVTTFSRIAVDNTLKIVTETNEDGEDVIIAIYIVR